MAYSVYDHVNNCEDSLHSIIPEELVFGLGVWLPVKYLSMGREGSTITQINDIENVQQTSDDSNNSTIENAQIIGVQQLDSYRACLRCNARVEPQTPPLARCTKKRLHYVTNICNLHWTPFSETDFTTKHTNSNRLWHNGEYHRRSYIRRNVSQKYKIFQNHLQQHHHCPNNPVIKNNAVSYQDHLTAHHPAVHQVGDNDYFGRVESLSRHRDCKLLL